MKRFLTFLLWFLISISLSAQKKSIEQYVQVGDTVAYIDYVLELTSNFKDDYSKDSILYHLENVISITQKDEDLSNHFWAKLKLLGFQHTLNPDVNNVQQATLTLIQEIETALPNDSLLKVLAHAYQTRAFHFKYNGSPDTVIRYSQKAVELAATIKDSFLAIIAYETIAKANERIENWERCIDASASGLQLIENLPPNEMFLFNRVMYAICLTRKGASVEALKQLGILEKDLSQINWEEKHYLAWICKDASLCYETLDRPREALKMQRMYSEAISSGPRLKLEYNLEDLRKKYTDQAKENQILTLEIENRESRRNRNRILLLLGLAIAIILVLLAFFQLRQRYLAKETQRLKEMDEFKTRLYTNITHEFRTPLTVILGMSEQIRNAPKEWLNMGLENIERNGKQLLQLINQLLDLSKLDAGSYDVKLEQQDIPSHINYLFASIQPLMEAKNISSSITCNFSHPIVCLDIDKVEKVLLNLLSNAAKYTPENGRIELIAEEMDNQLYLNIYNSGEGIPAAQLPYIFDRFYQAEKTETGGTGIGLALVKELVEVMNGKIKVESKADIGTTFQLWIPMEFIAENAEKATLNTSSINRVQNISLPPKSDLDAPLLLLVEDHPDVSNYLKELLKKDYRIQTASNGEEGLALALKTIPDLIISDVMMPKMDGFVLCEQLKKDVRTSHIPIVLLTAKADNLSRLEGLEYGADAYLTKPFNKLELEIRLRKLLELRQQLQAKYSDPNFSLTTNKSQSNLEIQFLQKVQGIILDNLANEDFKVEPHLCRAMTMSRPQLYRKLKALKNCSPSDLIKHIRMQEAQRLLAQRQLSISEIAEQVGFKNPSYFTKVYSDTFGEAPSQAIKRF